MALRLRTEMPELKGITEWVNGEAAKEDFKDKPVLVHFWSISCGMCKESLPDINKMRLEYPQLQFVGIHMPRSEKDTDVDAVKEAIVKYELKHPQGIDNQHNVVDAFENEYVPAFYLFDKNGVLRHRSAGEKALSMLKKPLERVMGELE
ncbi:TlpA family protein disulfide reductase [Paenactinomyces guangxiensis]|uniref:TlpA family protein disulfide reductase n=1 Tax=Paenactinomyces guangxiensis TaxID=1490290 RepID=A0A7W2A958_9BACL|nr:TlpA disulfide reductase family protein [Paenactinomyces guangxiensis]MBA4494837.1 TlpA family protein disulfide reductase [Paenactinomyces guangxiensis]MBH8591920.1 TlpA family protein disulfide reductase [Paenactinomyces guangxiensis]